MTANPEPVGGIHVEDGVEWYRIDDVDLLEPFLINVTSPYDHWMFVSSSAAITAGRRNVEMSLFPYETDDRLHRAGGRCGPLTLVRSADGELWQPFAPDAPFGVGRRSVAKTVAGNQLRFQEHHPGLGLTFRGTWSSSRQHGLVRSCELLLDEGRTTARFEVLDGLLDVLPAGVELALQQQSSTLVDAYRRSELDLDSGLAIFTLEAAISDMPMAKESLTANVAWSRGLNAATVALSERQVRAFRSGATLEAQPLATGTKGAFLQSAELELAPAQPHRWVVVADVGLDHGAVAALRRWLIDTADPVAQVLQGVACADRDLVELAAKQDALQCTADRSVDVNHFANVLYNAMRGGALLDGHAVQVGDVARAMGRRNRPARARFEARVEGVSGSIPITHLRDLIGDDLELLRLVNEYIPLVFSRRHGDPSRPWNRFEIPLRSDDGAPQSAYEGNWRDIFQNWEALLHSFPDYLESAVAKFLSASTQDGHNPYRINQDGVDWEVPEDGSWGNFGYWGDHQIVYLHRLLDAMDRFHPGALETGLDRRAHAYADVPYRLRPYAKLLEDAKNTLDFDHDRQREVLRRESVLGTDGRLVMTADGRVHHASLAEKLLVPALAKLGNLVPGGGIWMNTQRPEWNDANNALVGNGLSVVTAFHLRDYLAFVKGLFLRAGLDVVHLDPAVVAWLGSTALAFDEHAAMLDPEVIDPANRRGLLDVLGGGYDRYRAQVYAQAPGEPVEFEVAAIVACLRSALAHVEAVTANAERPDGLVDSYRLLVLGDGTAQVRPLYAMLEGQVAALGSGALGAPKAVRVVDALFSSDLYRDDRGSFMLYPERQLPAFLDRNRTDDALLVPALQDWVDTPADLLRRDVEGVVRFAPGITNAFELVAALEAFDGAEVETSVKEAFLALHETVFSHQSFTGRSQSMYAYEGLGSIYWHMVVKLQAAVQRCLHDAASSDADRADVRRLREAYRRIRDGRGYRQTVADHGAFPLDPHSHTPAHAGARQPGMTGAVKEGVLVRLAELGVEVADGCVRFRPLLLEPADFHSSEVPWSPLGADGILAPGTLGFTYCGVPVVYVVQAQNSWTRVVGPDLEHLVQGDVLDRQTSRLLLSRAGRISRIDVGVLLPTKGK
ncbi:MAG: hypothetical protein ACI867_001301 [Glaciecola sp.]|jgi:hypothetical protein